MTDPAPTAREWLKRLRRWWICKRFHICRVHGTLMRSGGYNEPSWWCETCRKENEGRSIQREHYLASERVAAHITAQKDARIIELKSQLDHATTEAAHWKAEAEACGIQGEGSK